MVKSLSIQIQMITGNRTMAAPICTMVSSMTAKPAGRHWNPGHLEADAGQQGLHDRDADHALGDRADGRARQFQEMFALLGNDVGKEAPPARRPVEDRRETESRPQKPTGEI